MPVAVQLAPGSSTLFRLSRPLRRRLATRRVLSPLVGTWRLTRVEARRGLGQGERLWCTDLTGSLSYDSEGRMSVRIAPADGRASVLPPGLDPGGVSYWGS